MWLKFGSTLAVETQICIRDISSCTAFSYSDVFYDTRVLTCFKIIDLLIYYINFRRRLRSALCKDVPRGCSHHTNRARIYLKSATKSPRGLYFNSTQFHLNGCSSFDSTKEKFEVLSSSRDASSLTAFKGDGRLEHEKEAINFAVTYVVAKC